MLPRSLDSADASLGMILPSALRRLALGMTLLALIGLVPGCGTEKAETTPDVVAFETATLPSGPDDPEWSEVPYHAADLLLQDMVDPRLMEVSTQRVRVRAMSDGSRIAFLLNWDDATMDDMPGPGTFPDGCAVQLPRVPETDLPAPQMGESGRVVEIAYWRATWQAVVDGRGDSIRDIYPQAAVDHYPFEAASLESDPAGRKEMESRYAPARALGNAMSGPRESPVESLVAEGPGTLMPDDSIEANGAGVYRDGKWSVVISRPLPQGLRTSDRSQVAFAIWEGSHDEVGARKMRTGWIPIVRRSE